MNGATAPVLVDMAYNKGNVNVKGQRHARLRESVWENGKRKEHVLPGVVIVSKTLLVRDQCTIKLKQLLLI